MFTRTCFHSEVLILAGKIKCWHWILFAVAIAGTVVGAVLWFSLLGYSVDNGE